MIAPTDVVNHLRQYLPAVTNRFSDEITATATVSGSVMTVNATAHGLQTTDSVFVTTQGFNNAITAVDFTANGLTTFTVGQDHDLTEPRLALDPTTLTLAGMGSPWDGDHTIVNVANRRNFTILSPASASVAPDITNAQLVESRRANILGQQPVATVISDDVFTITVPAGIPGLPSGNINQVSIITGVRVLGAADAARADQLYTQFPSQKPYLFVVMGETVASKDERTLNDSVGSFTSQNTQKQTIMQNFSVLCYLPTAEDDTSGFTASTLAYRAIFTELLSVLYGFSFDDPITAIQYTTVSNGHGPGGIFNSSYYVHVYDWQLPSVITFEDGFSLTPDVAFRDINMSWLLNNDSEATLGGSINLDEEPLTP